LASLVLLPSALQCSGPLRALHSFPTRRSSDLPVTAAELREDAAGAPIDPDYPVTPVPRSARRGVVSISVVLIGFTVFAPTLMARSEEHTSELQSRFDLVCRLLLEKKKQTNLQC